eukprot:15464262-Alexandrium_andersonii.AAC.1
MYQALCEGQAALPVIPLRRALRHCMHYDSSEHHRKITILGLYLIAPHACSLAPKLAFPHRKTPQIRRRGIR